MAAIWNAVSDAVNHFNPSVSGSNKAENYAALREANAYNLDLYREKGFTPGVIDVQWTQNSRALFSKCSAKFYEWQYVPKGQPDKKYLVYVADEVDAPDEFNTLGYRDMLHFGIYTFEDYGANAIVFVIMPSDWKIYQHRFKTSVLNKIAKFLGGFAFSNMSDMIDNYVGHFLRHLG